MRANLPRAERGLWKKNSVIDNRYEVRGLARGGMGEVYFVFDREIGRMVAVKTPLPSVMENHDGLNRFYREAEAWISLGTHPNICSAYYVAELDGLPRLFIEYVDAGALDKWLREGTLSTFTEKLDMAIQIASGMNWTHTFLWTDNEGVSQTGIVHRDLKPANILMSRYGMALITDFGLVGLGSWGKDEKLSIGEENAQMIDLLADLADLHKDSPWQTMTIGGVPFGTPQYMAPEQFNDAHTAGMPADIYAFGCILYELFCGRRPFLLTEEQRQGIIFYQIMLWKKLHSEEPPPMPQSLAPGIDDELSQLMLECLDKDRGKRPGSFAAVRDRLIEIYSRTMGTPYPRPEAAPSELKADSLNNQGVSYATINQINRAEKHWAKALQADPEHVEAAFNRAMLGVRKGSLKEDEAALKMGQYLQSLQRVGQGSFLMGKLHLLLGDEYTAANIIEDFSKDRGGHPEAKKIRAMLIANSRASTGDMGLLEQAAINFKWFLDNGKEDPVTAVGYCHCLKELGMDYLDDYNKWRGRFPELPETISDAVCKYLPGFSEQRRYSDEFREALSLAMSKDGLAACAGMNDGRVYVYDLNSDAPSGIYLKEQRSAVTAIDISGNKRLIAVGLNGGGIAVVDFNTGQIIHIFGVSGAVSGSATGNVAAVRFLPGTIYLISAHDDGSVRVWDVKNLKAVGAYKTDKTPITALVISHDLKYVYTSHKGSPPRKWETKTGKLALNFSDHAGGSPTIAVSADGKLAATGSGDCAILWDAETGKPLEKLRGHSSAVVYAGFSADGRYIVSADETVVRIWDLKTRLVYRIIKLTGSAKCAAISQLDNRLIVSTGNDITLLNFDNAYALSYTLVEPAVIRESEISYEFTRRLAEAKEKLTHSDFIGAAILISAMRTLSGYEHNPEAVELLTSVPLAYKRTNPKTGWLLNNYPSSGAITNVLSITSDGRYLIEAGSDGMVRKVDASTGEIVTEIGTDGSSAASMAADFMSRLICTGTEDGNVVVIDLAASVLVNKFSRHKGPVKAVAMAADGRYCFSAASEKTIRVWDTQDGYLGRFEECAAAVTALALHKDERIVISGMEDGTVVFWDSVTGKAVASVACHAGAVISIALSGSGQYGLSAAEDGLVGLWNIKSSKLIRQFHTDDLNCLSAAFCPSNEYLFACGTMEGTIYIYSVEGDECLFRLTGHRDGVNALAFSPNGYYLYSACLDATVARWFIEWEPTAEENSSAAEPLKRIITQYLASENSEDSDKLKTIISAAGLGHMTGSAFELTKNQVAKGTVRKSVRRQPLIQEEIAAAPTAAEVKIKVETTRLKGVIAAIVLIVACVGAVLLMYNMKRTRYNTSQLTDLVKTDDYFALVYDAVKFMDKHPAGCNPSNIDIYKESYAVFIKKGRAVVSGLQPKSLENIGCLISLRSDKVVVANLIDEMVADPVNSQGLSVLLSYMGGDVIPQLTEFLGNERFVKGNEAGAKLVVSTLAAMTTGDASSALANLVSGNPYLGPAAAPHLGRIFSTKQLEPDKALQLIETLMMSQDEKVRKDAVSALIFIKGSRAKGILQKAASDSSATVSKEASKVLASF